MDQLLSNLEYFDTNTNSWNTCLIKETFGEKSFVVKNHKKEEIIPIDKIRQINNVNENTNAITEYKIADNEYIECKIKQKKGKFLSLITNTNKTLICRETDLRYIKAQPLTEIISNSFSNISIEVPKELSHWCNSESMNEIFKNLSQEEQYIFYYNTYPEDTPKYIRLFCKKEDAEFLKMLVDTAIDNELKLCQLSNATNIVRQQIEDFQNKNKIIYINPKFLGFIIGTQGSNLKKLKRLYNVNIYIDNEHTDSNGNVKITVSGENAQNVETCADLIDITKQYFYIKNGKENYLKKMVSQMLKNYSLKNFYVNYNDFELDDGSILHGPSLTVIGPKKYIEYMLNDNKYYISPYNN